MYAFPDMVDIGLEKGQTWPHEDYRTVAQNCCLGNPNINQAAHLHNIVQSILRVPVEEIRKVTKEDFIEKYGCDNYWFY